MAFPSLLAAALGFVLVIAGAPSALGGGKTPGGATIDPIRRAQGCFEEGDFDCTISRATEAVEEDPENAEAWYWLGRAYWQTGRFEEAVRALSEVIAPGPDTPRAASALYWLGEAYYPLGRYGEAAEAYDTAVALDLTDDERGEVLYGLGAARYQLEDYDGSIAAFDEYAAGPFTEQSGHLDYWLAMAHRQAEHYGVALEYFDLYLSQPGADKVAYINRGWAYIYVGRHEEALVDARWVEGSFADDQESTRNIYRVMAFAHLGLGDAAGALDMLEKARRADPEYDASWDFALIHYAAGDPAKAQAVYFESRGGQGYLGVELRASEGDDISGIEVVKVLEDSAAARSGLEAGDVILAMDGSPTPDLEDAIGRLHRIEPGTQTRLTVLRDGGEIELPVVMGAAEFDAESLAENPSIAPYMARRAVLDEAATLAAEGRPRDALNRLLTMAIERALYRDEITAVIELAQSLDPPPAIPEEAKRHAIRAQTLVERVESEADYKKVFEEFELSLRYAPWWADAYYNYALAREAAGDPAGAIEAFKLFLLVEPDTPSAAAVRNNIYALEILAEEVAEKKRWEGTWQAGSTFESTITGEMVTMRYLEPTESSQAQGYRVGETDWWGRFEGDQVKGTAFIRTDDPDTIRCFGNPFENEMVATLNEDGNTITVDYLTDTYTISTCAITRSEWKSWTYERVGR